MSSLRERVNRFLIELGDRQYRPLEVERTVRWKMGDFRSPEEAENSEQPWQLFQAGDRWGGNDAHAWFQADIQLKPEDIGKPLTARLATCQEHKNQYHLVSFYAGSQQKDRWDIMNPQFILYLDGRLNQGVDVNHNEIDIDNPCKREYRLDFCAYGGMNEHLFEFQLTFFEENASVGKLKTDVEMIAKCADMLEDYNADKVIMMDCVQKVIDQIPFYLYGTEEFLDKIRIADEWIQEKVYKELGNKTSITAACVGHTHIDVGWLWTVEQTREKVIRSFSTVIKLMKRYPQYIFMSSQPQLYQFVKEEAPELYEEIREMVKEGRWEAEGSSWVEPDCNLISGESMVRQLLYGKRFFKEEFGVENRVLWLPDVFGYSASMPQILKKSGVNYFLTSKISWNQYNKLPFDVFSWKGIDGTEILSYFLTTKHPSNSEGDYYTTYNGQILPQAIEGGWRRFQQKEISKEILIAYGYGDGGGGATAQMLENAERLSKAIPGCPRVRTDTVRNFFERLEYSVEQTTELPCWDGELYLENHQGTYTSMAQLKNLNRRCEFGMMEAEGFCVLLRQQGLEAAEHYFHRDWKTMLLNQFHDILPGTCIKEVYDAAVPQMKEVLHHTEKFAQNAMNMICAELQSRGDALVVFNMLSFVRNEYLSIPVPPEYADGTYRLSGPSTMPYSGVVRGGVLSAWIGQIPSKGWTVFNLEKTNGSYERADLTATERSLENQYFIVELSLEGTFTRLYDKRCGRELLKPGMQGNVLEVYEDLPEKWDTWNIEEYSGRKKYVIHEAAECKVLENNGISAAVKVRKVFHKSCFEQIIRIYADRDLIDIENHVIWKERGMLLKAVFPFDINTDFCTSEIQFGSVRRPTHNNTSWQRAQYEMCIHKWVDVSDNGYGISLLNDSKYGCDVKHGNMRLTLLKAGRAPYPEIDEGEHHFTYSVYPHIGTWAEAGTVKHAYALNLPVRCSFIGKQEGSLPTVFSFVECSSENIVVETIKLSEDGQGIVMRLYESSNKRTDCVLKLTDVYSQMTLCDLMEKDQMVLAVNSQCVELTVLPFEIVTIKLIK